MGIAVNVALLAAALYFYIAGNSFAALICAAILGYRVLQTRLARLFSIVSRLQSVPSEHGCNTGITCLFSVERALTHPSAQTLYERLHSRGKVKAANFESWAALIVENYKRKYKRDSALEEVHFNIKNAVMFKNGEINFNDSVYHEIEIPYEWVDGERPVKSLFTPDVELDVSLRVLLVNGMLKLQLGRFDKTYSPNIIREGSLAVYETWATITTFPFMYFSHRHGLPVRYLNLSSHATSSYKATLAERGKPKEQKRFWQRSPGMFDDWSRLHHELDAYRILCDEDSSDYSWSTIDKLTKAFETKRDALLASEGFDVPKKDADDWGYPDTGETCSNDYLRVSFQNLNLWRESAEKYWLVDFYEERP